MNSAASTVTDDDTARWHRDARAGVLLLGLAAAGVPFLQQVMNVLFLVGAPKHVGPVSVTAIIVMAAFLLGFAGANALSKTPLPSAKWLLTFNFVAVGVVIVGNKVLHVPIVQSLTVLSMLGAVVIYLMQVDRHVRPAAPRLLWWLPIAFLVAIGVVIAAQRLVDDETQVMLVGAAGVLSLLNVPLLLVPVMDLRKALRD